MRRFLFPFALHNPPSGWRAERLKLILELVVVASILPIPFSILSTVFVFGVGVIPKILDDIIIAVLITSIIFGPMIYVMWVGLVKELRSMFSRGYDVSCLAIINRIETILVSKGIRFKLKKVLKAHLNPRVPYFLFMIEKPPLLIRIIPFVHSRPSRITTRVEIGPLDDEGIQTIYSIIGDIDAVSIPESEDFKGKFLPAIKWHKKIMAIAFGGFIPVGVLGILSVLTMNDSILGVFVIAGIIDMVLAWRYGRRLRGEIAKAIEGLGSIY